MSALVLTTVCSLLTGIFTIWQVVLVARPLGLFTSQTGQTDCGSTGSLGDVWGQQAEHGTISAYRAPPARSIGRSGWRPSPASPVHVPTRGVFAAIADEEAASPEQHRKPNECWPCAALWSFRGCCPSARSQGQAIMTRAV